MKSFFILILYISLLFSCRTSDTEISTAGTIAPLGIEVEDISPDIWTMYQSSDSTYWYGSNGDGVYRYDDGQLYHISTAQGLVDNTIRSIQEDKAGNIYVETPEGISRYDSIGWTTLIIDRSTPAHWQLTEDDLWFSMNTQANDIYRYDGERLQELQLPRQDLHAAFSQVAAQNLQFTGFNPYAVFGIDRDHQGNLWIGTGTAGVYRYDGESFIWINEDELSVLPDGRVPGVRSIIQDQEGHYWLSNMLHRYAINDDGSYTLLEGMPAEQFPELPYFMSSVMTDNGDLWMSTYSEGLWQYDGDTLQNHIVRYQGQPINIMSIYRDLYDRLWVTTADHGLYYHNGSDFVPFDFSTSDLSE